MSFYRYDVNGNAVRNPVVVDTTGDEIRVEQSHKDEVDVNVIVRKHGMELIQKVAALQEWRYDNVVGNDFQESMNALIKARDTFDMVPSDIRKQFDNDPAKFMDFVHDPANEQWLIDNGLAEAPPPAPEPVPVAVVSQAPGPEASVKGALESQ